MIERKQAKYFVVVCTIKGECKVLKSNFLDELLPMVNNELNNGSIILSKNI